MLCKILANSPGIAIEEMKNSFHTEYRHHYITQEYRMNKCNIKQEHYRLHTSYDHDFLMKEVYSLSQAEFSRR